MGIILLSVIEKIYAAILVEGVCCSTDGLIGEDLMQLEVVENM